MVGQGQGLSIEKVRFFKVYKFLYRAKEFLCGDGQRA
jgi:hypothetical protein